MYTTTQITKDSPPAATRFLGKRILCGHCRFKCCNSQSLSVECTEEEQQRLGLPAIFPIAGGCPELRADGTGCRHGAGRPVICKLAPLQVKGTGRKQSLVIAWWFTINCPFATDYVLETSEPGRWQYRLRPGVNGAKKINSHETLILPHSIQELPTALEGGREALVQLYGEAAYLELEKATRLFARADRGLGLGKEA